MEQKGFKREMLVDLLQRPYEVCFLEKKSKKLLSFEPFKAHYMKAVQAYNDQHWKLCIEEFNQGMDAFLKGKFKIWKNLECKESTLTSIPLHFELGIATKTFKPNAIKKFPEEETCRSQCEDSLDWSAFDGDNPEISVVMTSEFLSQIFLNFNNF
jgi:hypothetical protein